VLSSKCGCGMSMVTETALASVRTAGSDARVVIVHCELVEGLLVG